MEVWFVVAWYGRPWDRSPKVGPEVGTRANIRLVSNRGGCEREADRLNAELGPGDFAVWFKALRATTAKNRFDIRV
jgi:hypothetical protein